MQSYVPRHLAETISGRLRNNPVAALLGPRQCGKSTLAQVIISRLPDSLYLDLERPSDRNKLTDPETFFRLNQGKLICLDEIQRTPDIFPVMRSIIDEQRKNGQFLVLGSASPDLIRQSSETLAGRISYLELTPFVLREIDHRRNAMQQLWLRGGFPRSFLAADDAASFEWRLDFIRTFLERDIPQLGFRLQSQLLDRFWRMVAHVHGQLLNSSRLGESLGVSHHTVRSYIDILEQTFILRVLPPYFANLKKRLVKSAKVFVRDTGLLHALLDIRTDNDLLGHPVYGSSWESFVIENVLAAMPDWRPSFYRTASGSEIDLLLERGRKKVAVECKVGSAPKLGKGFWNALNDLDINEAWVIAPVQEPYPIQAGVVVAPLHHFLAQVGNL
jgi:predicted AAA+ superfamily ATPase